MYNKYYLAMLWIIIAVVAVLVLWVISVQNKLVKSDEFCNNALKQINVHPGVCFL